MATVSPDFSVADVLAWARTKPADEGYNFQLPGGCALCQFLSATNRAERPWVVYNKWWDADGQRFDIAPELNAACASANRFDEGAWTFGQLVARLEKLCPDAPVPPSEWTRLDAYMADIETVVVQ